MKTIVLSIFTLLAFTAISQEGTSVYDQPHVEVIGNAEKEVVPDEIFVEITIHERKSGRDEFSIEYQEDELLKAVKERLPQIDILELEDKTARMERVRLTKMGIKQGATYTIKTSNVQEATTLFEIVDELELHSAKISRTDYSGREALEQELRLEAAQNAQEKANGYCTVLGNTLGKAIIISENTEARQVPVEPGFYNFTAFTQMSSNYQESKTRLSMAVQKIKFSSKLYVRFELK